MQNAQKKYETVIKQITAVRANNNKNWMAILQLAFKYAPEKAEKIMSQITECDKKISVLTKSLYNKEKKI